MSDRKCVHIECTATASGSWLCPTHQDEYEDVLARIMRASTPTPETHVYRGPAPTLSTLRDHIAKLERDALDSAGLPRYVLTGTPSDHRQQFLGPCECGRPIYGSWRDRGKRCDVCRELAAKPPTLREWLGDRVGELGRWADVLREQPVPAGCYTAWQWIGGGKILQFYDRDMRGWVTLLRDGVHGVLQPCATPMGEGLRDGLLMALFTRHPDVKPRPKPAAFPWDPYPEVV